MPVGGGVVVVPTVNFWAPVPLQSQISRRVPLAVAPPGESMQRPDCGFFREPSAWATHCCAPVPLQSQSWSLTPLAVPRAGDVEAAADGGQGGAAPGPVLVGGGGLAVPELNGGAVDAGVVAADVDALAAGTDDRVAGDGGRGRGRGDDRQPYGGEDACRASSTTELFAYVVRLSCACLSEEGAAAGGGAACDQLWRRRGRRRRPDLAGDVRSRKRIRVEHDGPACANRVTATSCHSGRTAISWIGVNVAAACRPCQEVMDEEMPRLTGDVTRRSCGRITLTLVIA